MLSLHITFKPSMLLTALPLQNNRFCRVGILLINARLLVCSLLTINGRGSPTAKLALATSIHPSIHRTYIRWAKALAAARHCKIPSNIGHLAVVSWRSSLRSLRSGLCGKRIHRNKIKRRKAFLSTSHVFLRSHQYLFVFVRCTTHGVSKHSSIWHPTRSVVVNIRNATYGNRLTDGNLTIFLSGPMFWTLKFHFPLSLCLSWSCYGFSRFDAASCFWGAASIWCSEENDTQRATREREKWRACKKRGTLDGKNRFWFCHTQSVLCGGYTSVSFSTSANLYIFFFSSSSPFDRAERFM